MDAPSELAGLIGEALEITRDSALILNCVNICSLQADALSQIAGSKRYGPEVLAAVDALERLLAALSAAGAVVEARQANATERLQALGMEE